MGLGNTSSRKYVTTFNGNFALRVAKGTQDSVVRTTKSNKEISELYYTTIEGRITKRYKQVKEFNGKKLISLNLEMKDGSDEFTLQLPYSSGLSNCFYQVMEKLDFSKSVHIGIGGTEGKESLFFRQGGDSLKWGYTKDNPNGKPQWEQIEVKGEMTWDNSKELKFFEKIMEDVIDPKIEKCMNDSPVKILVPSSEPKNEPAATPVTSDAKGGEDDLPF